MKPFDFCFLNQISALEFYTGFRPVLSVFVVIAKPVHTGFWSFQSLLGSLFDPDRQFKRTDGSEKRKGKTRARHGQGKP
jgi:hypothetical protein